MSSLRLARISPTAFLSGPESDLRQTIRVAVENGGLPAEAALEVLGRHPFVCIHVEATDEMGHAGDAARKTQAIADFDQRLLRPLVEGLRRRGGAFRLLVLPDHPTPIALRTHVKEPVPFFLHDSRDPRPRGEGGYSEWSVNRRSRQLVTGHRLIDLLTEKVTLEEILIP